MGDGAPNLRLRATFASHLHSIVAYSLERKLMWSAAARKPEAKCRADAGRNDASQGGSAPCEHAHGTYVSVAGPIRVRGLTSKALDRLHVEPGLLGVAGGLDRSVPGYFMTQTVAAMALITAPASIQRGRPPLSGGGWHAVFSASSRRGRLRPRASSSTITSEAPQTGERRAHGRK